MCGEGACCLAERGTKAHGSKYLPLLDTVPLLDAADGTTDVGVAVAGGPRPPPDYVGLGIDDPTGKVVFGESSYSLASRGPAASRHEAYEAMLRETSRPSYSNSSAGESRSSWTRETRDQLNANAASDPNLLGKKRNPLRTALDTILRETASFAQEVPKSSPIRGVLTELVDQLRRARDLQERTEQRRENEVGRRARATPRE